ncbi:MAG: Gfo/Idh/MocA family oxidoreductase [Firmicutes bacterium]|nr:Gfo/Idh/MocA family oxidoreductase [Bacillota bacterium]
MIRLGIVGLGYMGLAYSRLARQDDRVSLIAACDADESRLNSFGGANLEGSRGSGNGGVTRYFDYREMIDREALDAVYIALPDDLHRDPVVCAAGRGLHILVEKPLAMSVADAELMVEAISRAGVVCQVNHVLRWFPPLHAAKQRLASGGMGRVLGVTAWAHDRLVAPTRRLTWASRTSPIWFQMTHLLDAVRWLLGSEVSEVYAVEGSGFLRSQGIDTPDFVRAMIRYSGGESAYFDASWVYPEKAPSVAARLFEVVCAGGVIRVDTERQMLDVTTDRYECPTFFGADMYGRVTGLFADAFTGFIDAVAGGTAPVVSAMDGLAVVAAAAAVEKSIRERRPVCPGVSVGVSGG